jgi:DNA-binding MarR family transcriptional regulator
VSLTDKGAATLSSIQERVDAVAARSFYKITENDIDLLNQTTRKMYENLKI